MTDLQPVTVVRFNGGPQAGHGVVTPDGKYHIFAQFASASLVAGVRSFLSRFMLIDPWRMLVEAEYLAELGVEDIFDRMFMSENALLITPFHGIANRLRERARGDDRHGSCGLGIGEAMQDMVEEREGLVLRMKDLRDLEALRDKLLTAQHLKREQLYAEGILMACWQMEDAKQDRNDLLDRSVIDIFIEMLRPFLERVQIVPDSWLGDVLRSAKEAWVLTDLGFGDQGKGTTVDFLARERGPGTVIFEPAQGVLLDEWRGFHPYTTWSTCTFDNADALLEAQGYEGQVYRLGILRAYATRHGAGPFVTEDKELTERLPDPPSARGEWQGAFRVGHFDAVSARYAIAACGGGQRFDGLVITCLDRLENEETLKICTSYEIDGGMVHSLELGPFMDLGYQARLTKRLEHAVPVYEANSSTRSDWRMRSHLMHISEALYLPIMLTSWGPTHEDKHWEHAYARLLRRARQSA